MGFFSKKKKDADANPYADGAGASSNPSMSYQQPDSRSGTPGAYANPAPPPYHSPSIASSKTNGFANNQYGSKNGYGADRYGNTANSGPRAGGYGGFDDDTGHNALFGDGARNRPPPQSSAAANANTNPALFGDAQNRYDIRQQAGPMRPTQPTPPADDEYGGYGAPRELTEEEKEEQELSAIHDNINNERDATKDTLSRTTQRLQGVLAQANGVSSNLQQQGDRLYNTARKLDEAAVHSKDSAEKTKELKRANGSMFRPINGSPFGRKKRQDQQDQADVRRHQEERDSRTETLQRRTAAKQAAEEHARNVRTQPRNTQYNFSDGEDDDGPVVAGQYVAEGEGRHAMRKEREISEGLDGVLDLVGQLKQTVVYQGEELDRQNALTKDIDAKTCAVDDQIRLNRSKLNRIR